MAKQSVDPELSVEQLRARLTYDLDTGVFTWNERVRGSGELFNSWAGRWAGHIRKSDGNVIIRFNDRLFRAHRLAFLWVTGAWPDGEVDHRDGNPSNNRWVNLRIATSSQNKMNTKRRADNTTGYKGVWWEKRRRRWVAEIHADNKRRHLGSFDTAEAAHAAYTEAARLLHGEYRRATD